MIAWTIWFPLVCADTPNWNFMGEDCDVYRRDYCYAGTTIVGAQFNNPEMNCCGCGKEKQGKQNINNIVALKCNKNIPF